MSIDASYSLRPEILVGEMDVSRRILVLDTSIFIHFNDKYFRTEGVPVKKPYAGQVTVGLVQDQYLIIENNLTVCFITIKWRME